MLGKTYPGPWKSAAHCRFPPARDRERDHTIKVSR
jgi:hypothetical protein